MSVVVVDAAVRDKLLAGGGVVEVRDPSGRVVGTFTPGGDAGFDYKNYDIGISEEEIERRLRSDRWYTPEQVMERLRSLRDAR